MAKQSPAKIKKLRGEAMRAAAVRKAERAQNKVSSAQGDADLDAYAAVDGVWRELGLAAPVRRSLVDEGYYKLSDLRKTSLDAMKDLQGMGPNALRIITSAMKKADLTLRK